MIAILLLHSVLVRAPTH